MCLKIIMKKSWPLLFSLWHLRGISGLSETLGNILFLLLLPLIKKTWQDLCSHRLCTMYFRDKNPDLLLIWFQYLHVKQYLIADASVQSRDH